MDETLRTSLEAAERLIADRSIPVQFRIDEYRVLITDIACAGGRAALPHLMDALHDLSLRQSAAEVLLKLLAIDPGARPLAMSALSAHAERLERWLVQKIEAAASHPIDGGN